MLKKLFVMTLVLALGSFISLGCKKEAPKAKPVTAPVTDAAKKTADEAAKTAEDFLPTCAHVTPSTRFRKLRATARVDGTRRAH